MQVRPERRSPWRVQSGLVLCLSLLLSGCSTPSSEWGAERLQSGTSGVHLHGHLGPGSNLRFIVDVGPVSGTGNKVHSRLVVLQVFDGPSRVIATERATVLVNGNAAVRCSGDVTSFSTAGVQVRPRAGLTWRQVCVEADLEVLGLAGIA